LFTGGICLAKAFVISGLSMQLGEQLSAVTSFSIIGMMAVIALAVTFMTKATSNTATTAMLIPVLAATSINAEIDPLHSVPAVHLCYPLRQRPIPSFSVADTSIVIKWQEKAL
jgi:sodium-dependent dicarboxylate transporter 2/3/5